MTTDQQQAELRALLGMAPTDEVTSPPPCSRRVGRRQQTRDTEGAPTEEPAC